MSEATESRAHPGRHILPAIVLAQFAGTSVWFVGNAVLPDLAHHWPRIEGALGWLTASVQLGFIAGTLLFALTGLSDRMRGHQLFAACATLGAIANAASMVWPSSFAWFAAMRFATGVCLAGVYPVGMKLAASWVRQGLGSAIGFLVGALVLGTAFPHLLKSAQLAPTPLVLAASGIAVVGGLCILVWVPEGPAVRRAGKGRLKDAFSVFGDPGFRSAALGYFGHMWELYALWAFVPFAVSLALVDATAVTRSTWAFAIIGAGSLGCIAGGYASKRWGSARVAWILLTASGACCLVSPWVFASAPRVVILAFALVWGVAVVGDSPQFSAVAARCAPPDKVGTGLTLMNAIGFALTIPAVALLSWLHSKNAGPWLFLALLPGPILGAISLRHAVRHDPTRPVVGDG